MVNFADRMANIKASDIRELLKIAARPDGPTSSPSPAVCPRPSSSRSRT